MKKEEVIEKAQRYSKQYLAQAGYMAGFKESCNIIRAKINECYNADFCDEMEKLSEVAYMEFEDYE